MTRSVLIAGICLFALLTAGCSSMQVQHDWDETVNFDQFNTFKVADELGVSDPLVARRISDAIRTHLTERNLTEDTENPDFLVAAHITLQDRVDVQTWGYSASRSRSHWHSGNNVSVSNYTQGTLLIDFVEASSNELFWRGWGSKPVTTSSRDASSVQSAVDSILDQYPPK